MVHICPEPRNHNGIAPQNDVMRCLLLSALILALLCMKANAQQASDDSPALPWAQADLSELHMRELSKDQCMEKTIASLKSGCTSDQCLKTLAGITGDCTTWAKGDAMEFCTSYRRAYISRYCASNELDARRCILLHISEPKNCAKNGQW
ncbi:hypothetical protein D3C84_705280 [compost metagenome]|jgi:hypothetical protein